MSVAVQSKTFLIFFLVGIIITLIFDIFRGFRKSFNFSDIAIYFQDIIFLFMCGLIIFRCILKYSNGDLRFYIFFAIFLGILICSLTLSKPCVIMITVILKVVKFPYYFVKKVFNNLAVKLQKISNNKSKKSNQIKEK